MQYLISGSWNRKIMIWRINNDKKDLKNLIKTLSGHEDWISNIAID